MQKHAPRVPMILKHFGEIARSVRISKAVNSPFTAALADFTVVELAGVVTDCADRAPLRA